MHPIDPPDRDALVAPGYGPTSGLAVTATLSIAQLAERSGVAAGTLRMWEARHGFPTAARSAGGHRRYSEHDLERVRRVLTLRAQGVSLPAAIAAANRVGHHRPPSSIFAGLRASTAQLQPVTLSKRAVLALTRALEDEYLARGEPGVLIGSFQQVRYYRQSIRYWQELAQTAEVAIALADFEAVAQPVAGVVEVPLPPAHAAAREWLLILDAPTVHACLAAWERPTPRGTPEDERCFEVVWSVAADQVRLAVQLAAEIISGLAPQVAARLPDRLRQPLLPGSCSPGTDYAMTHRMLAYLANSLDARA